MYLASGHRFLTKCLSENEIGGWVTLQTFWSLRGEDKFVTLAGNIILISFLSIP
jgi:hypothetical protein